MEYSIEKKDRLILNLLESAPFPSLRHIQEIIGPDGWAGLGLYNRPFNAHTKKLLLNNNKEIRRARYKITQYLRKYEKYLDNDFTTQLTLQSKRELSQIRFANGWINKKDDNLHSSHNERLFELFSLYYTISILKKEPITKEENINLNKKLKESLGRGPDIRYNHENKRYNIECTTPFVNSKSKSPEIVNNVKIIKDKTKNLDKVLTKKIGKKLKIFNGYYQDNIIGKNEKNIIFVSMSNFSDFEHLDYIDHGKSYTTLKLKKAASNIFSEDKNNIISGIAIVKNTSNHFLLHNNEPKIIMFSNINAKEKIQQKELSEDLFIKVDYNK